MFAPIDGEVLEVKVDHNSVVEEGQPLVILRNREIEIQITDLEGQRLTTFAEQWKVKAQLRHGGEMKKTELRALQGEDKELKTKMTVIEEKLQLQKARAEQLIIRSPINGLVTSWDVEKTLRSRPIMTGQVLMEVADLEQPYFLDLDMPEKREGHLDEYVKANDVEIIGCHLHLGQRSRCAHESHP